MDDNVEKFLSERAKAKMVLSYGKFRIEVL